MQPDFLKKLVLFSLKKKKRKIYISCHFICNTVDKSTAKQPPHICTLCKYKQQYVIICKYLCHICILYL